MQRVLTGSLFCTSTTIEKCFGWQTTQKWCWVDIATKNPVPDGPKRLDAMVLDNPAEQHPMIHIVVVVVGDDRCELNHLNMRIVAENGPFQC